jgi:hypothetical protein
MLFPGPAALPEAATTARSAPPPVPVELLRAPRVPDIVLVPKRRCLAVDGAGSPQGADFQAAVPALFRVAYGLKFARKKAGGADFKVGPLEGHWSADVEPGATGRPPPERWRWRLRIGVPADATKAEIASLKTALLDKKHDGAAELARIFLETVPAQRLGRVLHVGPYADEPQSLAAVDKVLRQAGLAAAPTHIEVYRKDPRRVRPAALETVLLRELAS